MKQIIVKTNLSKLSQDEIENLQRQVGECLILLVELPLDLGAVSTNLMISNNLGTKHEYE